MDFLIVLLSNCGEFIENIYYNRFHGTQFCFIIAVVTVLDVFAEVFEDITGTYVQFTNG